MQRICYVLRFTSEMFKVCNNADKDSLMPLCFKSRGLKQEQECLS